MALGDVQAALARLFTDEAARQAFLQDPADAGRSLGLELDDCSTLARLAPEALRRFAGSLKSKRALDARKMLPLTARTLGDAFAAHYSAAVSPLAPGVHRSAQAQAFAVRLQALARARQLAPAWIGDLARYEATFVEASRQRFGLRLRLFRFAVGSIAFALLGGGAVGVVAPRRSLGVWVRLPSGRLFHRIWALTPGKGGRAVDG